MGDWVTASTKVKKEVLEKAREYNINVSETLRRALEEEVRKREEEEARESLRLASRELTKISQNQVVEELRKWRRQR
ncbi:type II toxin-antitoxin system CcdA family antitoxin [Metallosphaera hakonensis]|uniref:VapB-type antitoxin n=1 Tax=Metallosphaera hakonensis JCM 8857 = DSM 7519 TaxID=1293036 RepID=A0A2U9IQR6_9CREN|nr:type II toxin-antitoxin system CcdA family antitoxin [Metallosphaera hakonensis]AWR98389.1 hypothetical protein DFR87_00200 [Metallosphaera hakonensis JCM 8857 = DSM 7519]